MRQPRFYAISSVSYLVLLLALCVLNYWAVSRLSRDVSERSRTWIFASTVVLNLAVLIFFKYATGLISHALARLGCCGPDSSLPNIFAPLGLSYFTFQMLACITDAYRRSWQMDRGLGKFILFGFSSRRFHRDPFRAHRVYYLNWPAAARPRTKTGWRDCG